MVRLSESSDQNAYLAEVAAPLGVCEQRSDCPVRRIPVSPMGPKGAEPVQIQRLARIIRQ